MSTIFNLDSPIMRALSRMADLLILNLITLLCCLPIITAGASLTAMHYMCLKLARHEECYVIRGFFKSFKQNFKQATIIWLIMLVVIAILLGDLFLLNHMDFPHINVVRVIIMIAGVLVLFTSTFIFPTLAKFDNPVGRTIKNAFAISVLQFPKTVTMILLNAVPVLLLLVIRLAPFSFLFGFSVPAWLAAFMYSGFFKKLEDQINEKNGVVREEIVVDDDAVIFHDEIDEALLRDENK